MRGVTSPPGRPGTGAGSDRRILSSSSRSARSRRRRGLGRGRIGEIYLAAMECAACDREGDSTVTRPERARDGFLSTALVDDGSTDGTTQVPRNDVEDLDSPLLVAPQAPSPATREGRPARVAPVRGSPKAGRAIHPPSRRSPWTATMDCEVLRETGQGRLSSPFPWTIGADCRFVGRCIHAMSGAS